MRLHPRLLAAAAGLALAGCVLAPPQLKEAPQLAGIPPAFELAGRLALRQGDRSDIAKLRWSHRDARDEWVIATPLGNEVARIESDPHGAVLHQGAEEQRAASFGALTQALLGVALDPAQLARWVHGLEPPEAASGWQVTIEERQPAGALSIAKRLSASRGDVHVRLVVDDYRLP
jgi:outer membrane biogenesis lipoprotein LolB